MSKLFLQFNFLINYLFHFILYYEDRAFDFSFHFIKRRQWRVAVHYTQMSQKETQMWQNLLMSKGQ